MWRIALEKKVDIVSSGDTIKERQGKGGEGSEGGKGREKGEEGGKECGRGLLWVRVAGEWRKPVGLSVNTSLSDWTCDVHGTPEV